MTASIATLEEWEEKQKAAEERRKTMEGEKMEKLTLQEKHAKEVREKKEKIKAQEGTENGKE